MTLDYGLIWSVLLGVSILLFLILYLRLQAFLALLISSVMVGIFAGVPPLRIVETVQQGMANTLGFVAVVVGLGAIFGAILEHSGGAQALARFMIGKFGEHRASWALSLTGFFVAIPVFFDVGFIILVPLIYALQRRTNKSLLAFALPLLSGLAITHAFIPPTPGPVAVADILQADLGWVIVFGTLAGIPAAIISGPLFSNWIGKRIHLMAPENEDPQTNVDATPPPVGGILVIIGLPIVLILANTVLSSSRNVQNVLANEVLSVIQMLGHPFVALIIANLIAWYTLGVRRGFSLRQLQDISTKSLAPAGIIILLTGAGGVFKQMLVNTGTGEMLARYFAECGVNIFIFAFVGAALIRILQGSATVAMITAAGITAPLLSPETGDLTRAMLVIGIAAGSSLLSHVNDSGFWLVSKYLGMNEKQTFQSWTMMTTILGLVGFAVIFLLSLFLQ